MQNFFLVLATKNQGKISEFQELLKNFPVEIKSLNDFRSIPEPEEDGKTFEENAYKKASFYAGILGLPCIAEDSGLMVTALDGAPGIFSARYAGENATNEERIAKLLREMEGKTDRTAVFVSVISIAVPTGQALTYEGTCQGVITHQPRGGGGFGYDPVFYYPPLQKTFAELTTEEKNKVSHRGKAFSEFIEEFDKVLVWTKQRMRENFPCHDCGEPHTCHD